MESNMVYPRNCVNILDIYRKLGKDEWQTPQPLGDDGWSFKRHHGGGSILVSVWNLEEDKTLWIHASLAWRDKMPSYQDLKLLHNAVFGDHFAYQIFAPAGKHINIHSYALHLWGRLDGKNELPDFGRFGTI
jgi:hypothetical protein